MAEKSYFVLSTLPDDILSPILGWVHGIGLGRLQVTGDTLLLRRMRENGGVKRYFMDWGYSTRILRWPTSFQIYRLTHFSFYRGNVLSTIQFAFTAHQVLMLPETLEFLALGGYDAEALFVLHLTQDLPKSQGRDMTQCVVKKPQRYFLNISKIFPNLTSLTLRENGNTYFFEAEMIKLLPPTLTSLSLFWNGRMKLTCTSFLPDLAILRLANSNLLSTFPSPSESNESPVKNVWTSTSTGLEVEKATSSISAPRYLPPTLTKLLCHSIDLVKDIEGLRCLPDGLLSLDAVMRLPANFPSLCSLLPNRLTRLSGLMAVRGKLPSLPDTISCLSISVEGSLEEVFNFPIRLRHLRIRHGIVTAEALRNLPASLEKMRICAEQSSLSISDFVDLQPQYVPLLTVLDLRAVTSDAAYNQSDRHTITNLRDPEYRSKMKKTQK